MQTAHAINVSGPSRLMKWGSYISSVFALLGSLLVTLQSPQLNPPHTFDMIQTRVDAFVR